MPNNIRKAYLLAYRPESKRTKFSLQLLLDIGFDVCIVPTIYHQDAVISNKISMQSIYNEIVNSEDAWSYVFEDDINQIESIDISELIEYEKISNYFFYLGCCLFNRSTIKNTSNIVRGHEVYSVSGFVRCLHGIGLSNEGAKKLLDFSLTSHHRYMDVILEDFSKIYPANIVRYHLESKHDKNHVGFLFQDREAFQTDIG